MSWVSGACARPDQATVPRQEERWRQKDPAREAGEVREMGVVRTEPLLWSGEHWIAYLRDDDGADVAAVSLYHAYTSPAGAGTVAFVSIGPAGRDFAAVCSDNPELTAFARRELVNPAISPFDPDAEQQNAELARGGDIRSRPGWTITTDRHRITAEWWSLEAPLVGPPVANASIVFTILVFAADGAIALDDAPMAGSPFLRDVWRPSLGAPRSSCCFALAETMVEQGGVGQ